MQHTRTWTDLYGSACARFEGRPGGHRWLVATPPELAAGVPAALEALDAKGSVELLVHDGVTPLLAALRDVQPRGVLIVHTRALSGGPETSVPEAEIESDGLAYTEGGTFPAWQAADQIPGEHAECPPASAAALLQVPVTVTTPEHLQSALRDWMSRTPHGI